MARGPSSIVERALLAALALSGLAAEARADLELCNRTSFIIEAALGVESSGSTATRGWFRVDPGACRAVMRGEFNADRLFVHARAIALYGSVRPLNQAQRPLCVGEGDFVVASAHRCAEANQKLAAFGEVLPRATESGFAVQLVEPADYSADQAKLAAIQRLLALAGYEAEPIDGVSGPRTDAALAMFLRERGLAAETAASPAFLDLLMDAVREGAGRGLLWCNETTHVVMAALAVEEKGSVVARGWWRIEPGACVRPDLSRRAGARVYSFAEAVDGTGGAVERAGKPLSWGGSKRLCVRNSRFEISEHDECPARGLSMHGFAAVDLSQRSGATVRFREP